MPVSLGKRERVTVGSEEVSVPPGVTIRVKRARTIEHSLEVNWSLSFGAGIEAGMKSIVSASTLASIERQQGITMRNAETIEYDIALDGEKSCRWLLTWTEIWRSGLVEVPVSGTTTLLPFRFLEGAQLEVKSIAS
jgi:hypothetical protein